MIAVVTLFEKYSSRISVVNIITDHIYVDIKFSSEITFIRYAQNRKIGKPNNLKLWMQ